MACNHPMQAFWTGNYTENGKKEYIIVQSCDNKMISKSFVEGKRFKINFQNNPPYIYKNDELWLTDPITIPCGHCKACKLTKSREWTTRICLESMSYKNAYFVTLTYDKKYLPMNNNLCKRDLTLFIKRLRKYIDFRYFACGEYGDVAHSIEGFGRPHYHLILLSNDELPLKPFMKGNSFNSDLIKKSWPFGIHDIAFADEGCIAYTAGYVFKKQLADDKEHLVKPFVTCSDQPGFGYSYLFEHKSSILDTKKVYFNGKSKAVFKYIWNKLSEVMDIQPIKDELQVLAGRSNDKLKWYFNEKYYEECSEKLDKIYEDYINNHRKEKI